MGKSPTIYNVSQSIKSFKVILDIEFQTNHIILPYNNSSSQHSYLV